MKYNEQTDWSLNYSARFKAMPKTRAEAIETVLYQSIKATIHEINAAVARLCEAWNDDKNDPNINAIAAEVRRVRYGDGAMVPGFVRCYRGDTMIETNMGDLKEWLKACSDPVEAWNLICLPMRTDQQRELQRFADQQRIKYERFVPVNKGGFGKLVDSMRSPECEPVPA